MNFKAELEKIKRQKWFKNIYNILKLWTKSEYLQLQLHFEDINNTISNELKDNFEKKYLSEYNIIPHSWNLAKLKSFQNLKTSNIGYILASNNITRKDILDNKWKKSLHSDFYNDWFTREAIFDIFKSEILDKKSQRNKLKNNSKKTKNNMYFYIKKLSTKFSTKFFIFF